jgi:hypothetical protein
MIKIYLNGYHYSTLDQMPRTIPGVKLSNLQSATKEQLLKHGITTEEYTPPVPDPPTPEELTQQFAKACEEAIQTMLDAKANELEYESIHTANGWVGELHECETLKAWGGECWRKSKAIRDAVLAGEREIPDSVEEFMTEIPTYDEYVGGL